MFTPNTYQRGELQIPATPDTGWQTPALSANFLEYDSSSIPKIRKIWGVVNFIGAIKPQTGALTDLGGVTLTANNLVTTLGAEYLSSGVYDCVYLCQGSAEDQWSLRVNMSTGNVYAHRYSGTPSTSTWLPFSVSWIAEYQ